MSHANHGHLALTQLPGAGEHLKGGEPFGVGGVRHDGLLIGMVDDPCDRNPTGVGQGAASIMTGICGPGEPEGLDRRSIMVALHSLVHTWGHGER